MDTRKFWPLDFDPEGEVYENVAWDLPGYRRRRTAHRRSPAGDAEGGGPKLPIRVNLT